MRQKGPGSDTLFISLKIRKQPKQYQPNKKNTCNISVPLKWDELNN